MNATTHENEAELEKLLGPRGSDPGAAPFDVDAMFAEMERDIAADEGRVLSRIRQQPTWRRQALAFASFVVVVLATVFGMPGGALATFPVWILAVQAVSLTVLFGLALVVALRPPHLPSLPPRQGWALSGAAIVATAALALVPSFAEAGLYPTDDMAYWKHTLPCLLWGLLVGLPIYGVLRVLDRGNPLGRLLAASAAGLAANVMLQLHCAMGDLGHLLGGHALVLVIYVAGVAATERVVGR